MSAYMKLLNSVFGQAKTSYHILCHACMIKKTLHLLISSTHAKLG